MQDPFRPNNHKNTYDNMCIYFLQQNARNRRTLTLHNRSSNAASDVK